MDTNPPVQCGVRLCNAYIYVCVCVCVSSWKYSWSFWLVVKSEVQTFAPKNLIDAQQIAWRALKQVWGGRAAFFMQQQFQDVHGGIRHLEPPGLEGIFTFFNVQAWSSKPVRGGNDVSVGSSTPSSFNDLHVRRRFMNFMFISFSEWYSTRVSTIERTWADRI